MTSGVPITPPQPQPTSAPGLERFQGWHEPPIGAAKHPGVWQRIFEESQAADQAVLPAAQSLEQKTARTLGQRDSNAASVSTCPGEDITPPDSEEFDSTAPPQPGSSGKSGAQTRLAVPSQIKDDSHDLELRTARGAVGSDSLLGRRTAGLQANESPRESAKKSGGSPFDVVSTSPITFAIESGCECAASSKAHPIAAASHTATPIPQTEGAGQARHGKQDRMAFGRVPMSYAPGIPAVEAPGFASSGNASSTVAETDSDLHGHVSVEADSAAPPAYVTAASQSSQERHLSPLGDARSRCGNELDELDPSVPSASTARQITDSMQSGEKPSRTHGVAEKEVSFQAAQPATNDAAAFRVHLPMVETNSQRASAAHDAASGRITSFDSRETFAALDRLDSAPRPTWIQAGAHRAEAGYLDPSLGWVAVRAEAHGTSVQAALIPGSTHAAAELAPQLPALNAHLAHHGTQANITMASPDGSTGSGQQGSARDEGARAQSPSSFAQGQSERQSTSAVMSSPAVLVSNGNLISIIV